MRKAFVLILCVSIISACATNVISTGSKNLSEDILNQVIEGKTTKAEVTALLGEPSSKIRNSAVGTYGMVPSEIWSYSKVDYEATFASTYNYVPSKTTTLSVNFDKDGIVMSYSLFQA